MRGVTLVEMVVASFLAVLLLVCSYLFLANVARASIRGSTFGQVEQNATLTFHRLIRDLQTSSAPGLTWNPDVGAARLRCLAIQPIADVNTDGRVVYSDDVLYAWVYDPGARTLRRLEWLNGPPVTLDPDTPKRLTTPQLSLLTGSPSAKVITVRGVDRFDVGNAETPPNVSSPLKPELELSMQAISNRVERMRLSRTVVLKQ